MLKLTGPRSLSSFVRTGLDVARVAMMLVVAVLLLVVAALVVALLTPGAGERFHIDDVGLAPITAGVAGACAYLVALLVIMTQLRRLFAALARSDVFNPLNARRLRLIGYGLVALEIIGGVLAAGIAMVDEDEPFRFPFNPTGWFAIVVVFILAEVFREGARLRRQSELTI
jgi:hypothetical protein